MAKRSQKHFGNVSDEFNNYWKESGRKVHGGAYAHGKRKTIRPFDSKKPLHLVLRSSRAKGETSMSKKQIKIKQIIDLYAKKWGITLYKYSNNGNHLHILLRAKHKSDFQVFLRTISGVIARLMLNAKKGQSQGSFWDTLAFTRIGDWGKAFKNLSGYVVQNILEAAGIIAYQSRKYKLVPINSTA
ncbi:MAG: transposase [Oligoflexia bacterium]|nr:transposase [Oligoflexia bacterium]